jgi:hypothetical protein
MLVGDGDDCCYDSDGPPPSMTIIAPLGSRKKEKKIGNLFRCCDIGKKVVIMAIVVVVVMMITNGYCNAC